MKSSDEPFSEFKVVEITLVTDEEIERLLNEWVAKGWRFHDVRFVTKDSSPRPAMAFLFFVRRNDSG